MIFASADAVDDAAVCCISAESEAIVCVCVCLFVCFCETNVNKRIWLSIVSSWPAAGTWVNQNP